MFNQKRTFQIMALCLLVLLLVGCKKSSIPDARQLPLGDSGYISEIEFKTKDSHVETYSESGIATRWVSYDYVEAGKTYVVTVNFGTSSVDGKAVQIEAGTYVTNSEGKSEFQAYSTSDYVILSSSSETAGATLEFVATSSDTVIKIVHGTMIDEGRAKAENPDAKKSAIKKIVKQYRGSSFVVKSMSLEEKGSGTVNQMFPIPVVDSAGVIDTSSRGAISSVVKTYFNTCGIAYDDNGYLVINLYWKGGPWQWIITQIGVALNWITHLVGGQYWLGLLITTLLIRSLGWPIYAKSNSMTTRMSAVQPEMDRINQKYEGKTDQNSQMKKQMEMREVMKKNKVSMFGCLLPFLQMPIFLWVYQVVQRYPITPIYGDGVKFKFLWTTFAANYGTYASDWILAALVGITMIGSQLLSTYMTKRIQKQKQNFYTKNKQQNKSNDMTMKIMMVAMTAMMVWFSFNSAGMAFYWIIGNVYQILQTFISKKMEEKKSEKERLASGRPLGR